MRGEACENKNNAEKWQSQTVCNVHHLPTVLTVITLLIILEFRQRLAFFCFSQEQSERNAWCNLI